MENENIMNNEEVIEATAELANAGLSKGFKIGIGVGVAVLVGGITYKYAVKPMLEKVRAKRAQQEEVVYEGEVTENSQDE